MIKSITLENFFSFGDTTTVELNPDINILLGINGSGKSNFLKAIHLLRESIVGEGFEKVFLKDWGGFHTVANFNQQGKDFIKITYEFDEKSIRRVLKNKGYKFDLNPIYEITIHRSGSTSYYLEEKLYIETDKESGKLYMEMANSRGKISGRGKDGQISWHTYSQENGQIAFKTSELVLRQLSDPHTYPTLFTLKTAIEKMAAYDYFDTTLKSVIRQPGNYDTANQLHSNGQNLTSILNRLKNHHSLEYEKIEKFIKKINPNFKEISFDILGSKMILVLREQFLSKSVSIEHISDGTLRFLILLSILFNPERGNTICIDEPEIGLHPDMINSVADAIKSACQNTQLIIATHSPLLLNAFELDEVLIFEKDEHNQTKVNIKSEEDFEDWNENYLTGQLWLRGLIGGKRW